MTNKGIRFLYVFLLSVGISSLGISAPTKFVVTVSATQTAGTTNNLTITADSSGHPATSYTGDKTLTFSGANPSLDPAQAPTVTDKNSVAQPFGSPTVITFTAGVASNVPMILYRAESASIAATDGSLSTPLPQIVNVTFAALAKFKLVPTSPQTNAVAFTGSNTLTAQDAFGNTVTTFNASSDNVTMSTSLAGTISGLGSGNNAILNRGTDFTSGVADLTARGMKYTGLSGTGTFNATSVSGKTMSTPPSITINAGPAARFSITGTPTQTAGASQNLTITAQDASGNIATTYTGDKTLTFGGASASTNPVTQPTVSDKVGTPIDFGTATTITFTSGVATGGAGNNGVMKLYKAEGALITATQGTVTTPTPFTVLVSDGSIGKLVLQLTTGQTNGVAFTGTNTITAQDDFGNVVTDFSAVADNVIVVPNSPLSGTITGLGSAGNNILNQAADFVTGVANVTGKLRYSGTAASGTFTATTATTGRIGMSNPVTVNPGGATHFIIAGSASQTAGTPQNLTITAKDAAENTDPNYTGDKSLTFAGASSSTDPVITPKIVDKNGSDVSFGSPTTITFAGGVATVAAGRNGPMKLYKAESASISATQGSITTPTPLNVTVGVAPHKKFATVLTSPQINGIAFSGTNTVAAQDSFGNVVTTFSAASDNVTLSTSLAGTISGLGSASNNVLDRASDFTSGVANIAGKIKYTGATGSGTFSVSSVSGKTDPTPPTVTINAGGAARLVITGSATQIAGTGQNLTITARDSNGNISTGYSGTKSLTFSGANPSTNPVTAPKVTDGTGADRTFGTPTSIVFASGVATVSGANNGVMTLYKTESALIAVTDGTISAQGSDRLAVTVNVTTAELAKFVFAAQSPQSNGTAFTGTNTIAAQDAYGNLVTTFDASVNRVIVNANSPLSGKVAGLGSGNDSTLNRPTDFVGGIADLTGVMRYYGVSGTGTFTAKSFSNKTGTSGPVTVNPGAVLHFLVAGAPTQTAGTIQPLTITAKDTTGNTVTAYTGDQSLIFSGANPSSNPSRPATVFDKNGNFASFGSAATITFANGIATATATANGAIQLFRAETASVVATQGSTTTQPPLQVVVSNAPLGQFSLSFASPQVNGSAFTGINSITAQDSYGNIVLTFDASADNVTLAATAPLVGTITGLGSLNNNVLNRVDDFVAGVGDLTGKLTYTGNAGTGTFIATSGSSRSGVSGNIEVTNPAPTLTSVNPANVSRSQTLDIGLRGTNFLTNVTSPSFGDSITVLSVNVNRRDSLTARVVIPPGTVLGPRNVSVTNVGNSPATLSNGLTINNIPSLTGIDPVNGLAGQSYSLTFTGTNFSDGISSVSYVGDPGITVISWHATSPTRMTVGVNISSGASIGPRQFFVFNQSPETYGGQSGFQSFTVGSNPVPTLTSVQPDSANRLERTNLTFKGTNFFTSITDVKMGDGIRVDTVIIDSSTQLRATVTIMDTAATGIRSVYVQNKTPGGGASGTRQFKVNNPHPTLTGVSPANASRLQTLDVVFVGTNFIQGVSSVNFGPGITRVHIDSVNSPTQLTARVTIDSNAATGTRNVTVTNPGPGGGTSASQTFTINNPRPTITNLSDTTKIVNSPQFVLTVDGTNFVGQSVVRINGTPKATTPVSATRLTATIPASDLDTAGVFFVTVLNPAPGGDTSNAKTLTVKNPAPQLTSVSPDSAARLQSLNIQLRGSNFVRGVTTVQISGDISVDTTTVIDTSRMTVKITIPANSLIGDHMIIVTNPPPGGGTSSSIPFKVTNNPKPTLLTLAPATGNRLQKLDVTVTGTNFINGVTTMEFGPGINVDSTIVLNPTHLTAKINISGAAATGTRTVTVKNAPPGGGTDSMTNAFQVNNPVPVLIGVSPGNGEQLQTLDLTFRGRNFIDGVTYVFMGTGISVNGYTSDSDSSFKASITITNFAAVGPRNVQVINPSPGGGTDQLNGGFVVGNNPKPTLTGINPTSGRRLDSLKVVFHGTNFISSSSVSFGPDIDVVSNVDTSTQLSANIFIRPTAATGLRTVYITNPLPGGGKDSIVNGFNVTNPAPTLATVDPSTIHRMQRLDLVLRGTKFINGVTTVNSVTGITVNSTSVDSSTRMAVNVTVDTFAVTGPHTISVTNPTPEGGTSGTVSLTVDNPTPTLTDVQPASGGRLKTMDIALTGTNFIQGISRVALDPPGNIAINSTRVDSATHITASITIAGNAVTGPRNLTVVNNDPGGGSSAAKIFTVEVNTPTDPVPTYPPDNQGNMPTSLALSWSTSTNASAYHVQLATTVGFTTTIVNDTAVSGTSRQVGPLNNNILYFWRVRARNTVGVYSNFSPIRRFTTKPSYPDTIALNNTWVFPPRNPGESVTADYKIVGLPGNSNSPVSSFIPGTAGTDWQMYWDNGTPTTPGCYVKYDPTSSRFMFTTGAAFWLIMRSSWTVNETISTAALNDSGKVGIPLHAGWNLITNPYNSAVFWYQVQAANGGFNQALSMYNSGWAGSSTFAPYTGYIFSNETNLDTLWIPYSIVALLSKDGVPGVSDGWRVSIDLQSGQYQDRVTSFGVSSTAKEGLDRMDNRRPRGIADIPTVSFHRPEWDQHYSDFATDIRPEFNDISVWKFEVASKPRKAIQLTFNGIGTIPPQFQVYLIDEARSRYVDLRANAVYEFTPATDISNMRVVVGTPEAVKQQLASVLPTVFELGNNFPNPFNPTTTIPVSVPRTADVTLKVYATTGEEVRTIYSGSLAPGRYWFTWDGRNERGNTVATGVYFTRFTTLAGPTFTGKMLLMK